jgi:hypothetical protein
MREGRRVLTVVGQRVKWEGRGCKNEGKIVVGGRLEISRASPSKE